jgi:hypothetical protein
MQACHKLKNLGKVKYQKKREREKRKCKVKERRWKKRRRKIGTYAFSIREYFHR